MSQHRIGIILPDLLASGGIALYLGLAKCMLERGHMVDLVLLSTRIEYRDTIPAECSIFAAERIHDDWNNEKCFQNRHKFGCLELGKFSRLIAKIDLRWRWRHAGKILDKSKIARSGELVRQYLHQCNPSAVLGSSTEANWATILGSTRATAKPRTVVTVHTNYELGRSANMTKCSRLLYPKADWVVGVSRGATECALTTLRLSVARTKYIYNGYPIQEIQKKANDQHGPGIEFRKLGVPVVLGVARQSAGGAKDLDTLIKAFAVFRKHYASKLALVRPGKYNPDETSRLKSLAGELQIANDVMFLGFTENPYSLMKHASVLVVSSHWEGFSNVLVEAMACGTPVVSTDTPFGPAEVLDGGRHGPLVPVGDVSKMATAIATVVGGGGGVPVQQTAASTCGRVWR